MKRRSKWTITYGAVGGLVGIMLGQLVKGDLETADFLGGLSGALLLIAINIFYVRSKKDKTPEFDERTMDNMVKFYAYASNLFLGLVFVLLGIILSMDVESISVFYAWIAVVAYFAISGIGALVVSRK